MVQDTRYKWWKNCACTVLKLNEVQRKAYVDALYVSGAGKIGICYIDFNLACNSLEKDNDIYGIDSTEEKVQSELQYVPIKETDSDVVKTIKNKLNESNGRAVISLYSGDCCEITYDNDGAGLSSPKIPLKDQLTWEVFDAAVFIVRKNGGKAMKGQAQSGAKLGNDKLPLNSVEGYIAYKVHGKKEGQTAFGPGFVICAVLEWAGICRNQRGYLEFNSLK